MSSAKPIPNDDVKNPNASEFVTPSPPKHASPRHQFLIPSPVPTRRTRTTSMSRLAADSPIQQGLIVQFCRERGHGFIKPDDEEKNIFLHISEIEDDYVVRKGDRVEFRAIPMPPKCSEKMAVEVRLVDLDESQPHERWDNKPDI